MPRLATFYGITVYTYVRDHGVAHFHARYGDDEAVIEVATGTMLRGSLSPGRATLVNECQAPSVGAARGLVEGQQRRASRYY